MVKGYDVKVSDGHYEIAVKENTSCRCMMCDRYDLTIKDLVDGSSQTFGVLCGDSDREIAYVAAIDILARRVQELEDTLKVRVEQEG